MTSDRNSLTKTSETELFLGTGEQSAGSATEVPRHHLVYNMKSTERGGSKESVGVGKVYSTRDRDTGEGRRENPTILGDGTVDPNGTRRHHPLPDLP